MWGKGGGNAARSDMHIHYRTPHKRLNNHTQAAKAVKAWRRVGAGSGVGCLGFCLRQPLAWPWRDATHQGPPQRPSMHTYTRNRSVHAERGTPRVHSAHSAGCPTSETKHCWTPNPALTHQQAPRPTQRNMYQIVRWQKHKRAAGAQHVVAVQRFTSATDARWELVEGSRTQQDPAPATHTSTTPRTHAAPRWHTNTLQINHGSTLKGAQKVE